MTLASTRVADSLRGAPSSFPLLGILLAFYLRILQVRDRQEALRPSSLTAHVAATTSARAAAAAAAAAAAPAAAAASAAAADAAWSALPPDQQLLVVRDVEQLAQRLRVDKLPKPSSGSSNAGATLKSSPRPLNTKPFWLLG